MQPGWLFVIPWEMEALGGVNRVVLELCKEMNIEKKYRPFILVTDWNARTPKIIENPDYTEIRYRLRGVSFSHILDLKALIMLLVQLPKALSTLACLFKEQNIKVVNPHYPTEALVNFSIYRLFYRELNLVVSLHGSDLLGILNRNFLIQKLWSLLFSGADSIVFCSVGLRKLFTTSFTKNYKQIITIQNGLSSIFLNNQGIESSEISDSLKGENYIFCVGAFERIKGQDILIEAFNKVLLEFPNLKLVLVGRSGSFLQICEEIIERYSLGSSIKVVTGVEQKKLLALYRDAKLYVSPSRHESFPLCLLESAAMNTPIVATKTIGAEEIISSSEEGILVPIEDADALAGGISYMLNNRLISNQCSINLYRKVVTNFTWQKALAKYMTLVTGN